MSENMRILHLFPGQSWGGAEMQVVDICGWQQAAGLDARVWCSARSPIFEECQRRGIRTITDWFPTYGVFPALSILKRVLRREKTTHLHVHWASGVRLVFGIKYFVDVKLIFYTHMWITKRKKDIFHRLAYRAFDKATVSGQRAFENVQKHLPWREDQLEICPYGVDFGKIPTGLRSGDHPSAELRAKWKLPKDALILGFFGRIDRQKGVKEFLEAAVPLLHGRPQLHLMVVGSPTLNESDAKTYDEEVTALINSAPGRERIHRFGHQREFFSILACTDLAVLPSYMECYSILMVQCFALGIPVVSTDAGGTPDLISEPERGWLVPSRSVRELRDTLAEIVRHPEAIRKKADGCMTYAETTHDHRKVVERISEIYGL